MGITDYRISSRGQMSLPASARKRWQMDDGGTVEVADLGNILIVAPGGQDGLRCLVRAAIEDAGGYAHLAAKVAATEPELA